MQFVKSFGVVMVNFVYYLQFMCGQSPVPCPCVREGKKQHPSQKAWVSFLFKNVLRRPTQNFWVGLEF